MNAFEADDLVYWHGDSQEPSLEELDEDEVANLLEGKTMLDEEGEGVASETTSTRRYNSMYVSLCEGKYLCTCSVLETMANEITDMIETVMWGESFIFTEVEQKFLTTIRGLPCEQLTRHLYSDTQLMTAHEQTIPNFSCFG